MGMALLPNFQSPIPGLAAGDGEHRPGRAELFREALRGWFGDDREKFAAAILMTPTLPVTGRNLSTCTEHDCYWIYNPV